MAGYFSTRNRGMNLRQRYTGGVPGTGNVDIPLLAPPGQYAAGQQRRNLISENILKGSLLGQRNRAAQAQQDLENQQAMDKSSLAWAGLGMQQSNQNQEYTLKNRELNLNQQRLQNEQLNTDLAHADKTMGGIYGDINKTQNQELQRARFAGGLMGKFTPESVEASFQGGNLNPFNLKPMVKPQEEPSAQKYPMFAAGEAGKYGDTSGFWDKDKNPTPQFRSYVDYFDANPQNLSGLDRINFAIKGSGVPPKPFSILSPGQDNANNMTGYPIQPPLSPLPNAQQPTQIAPPLQQQPTPMPQQPPLQGQSTMTMPTDEEIANELKAQGITDPGAVQRYKQLLQQRGIQ